MSGSNYASSSNQTDGPTEYIIWNPHFTGVWPSMLIFIWFLLVAATKLGYEGLVHHKKVPRVIKQIPESCELIILGLICGFIFPETIEQRMEELFTNHNFFIYILPPIILEAGYTVPMKPFANAWVEIFVYAVFGTLLNTFLVGYTLIYITSSPRFDWISIQLPMGEMTMLRWFLYAAIISAVDPVAVLAVFDQIHVNQTLYILVFGESLMNDGVAVVLYRVLEQLCELKPTMDLDLWLTLTAHFLYIVIGGIIIGVVFGFAAAFCTKFTYRATIMEPIVVVGMAYLSYLLAEALGTSAILSLVFCAFTMRAYVHHNISKESDTTIHNALIMLATLTEATIFLNLGIVGAWVLKKYFSAAFGIFVVSIVACFIFRFVIVGVLTAALNRWYRQKFIKLRDQIIMAYGGLRGGIAFSLMQVATLGYKSQPPEVVGHGEPKKDTIEDQVRGILVCSTLLIILFTCFIQGTTISYVVNLLHVEKDDSNTDKSKKSHFEESACEVIDEVMMGIRGILSKKPGRQYFWFRFDEIKAKLNPIFERDPCTTRHFDKRIIQECEKIQSDQNQLFGDKMAAVKKCMENSRSEAISGGFHNSNENNGGKDNDCLVHSGQLGSGLLDNDEWKKKVTILDLENLPDNPKEQDLTQLFREATDDRRREIHLLQLPSPIEPINSNEIKKPNYSRRQTSWQRTTKSVIKQKEILSLLNNNERNANDSPYHSIG